MGSNGHTCGSRTNGSWYGDWYGSRAFAPGGYPEQWTAANLGSLPLKQTGAVTIALVDMSMQPGINTPSLTQEHNLLAANLFSTPANADIALTQLHNTGLDSLEVVTGITGITLAQAHYLIAANMQMDVGIDNIALPSGDKTRNESTWLPRAMGFEDAELKLDKLISASDYLRLYQ